MENLLKNILHKLNIYNDGALFRTIAFIFTENKFSGISDRDLIFKILSLTEFSNRNTDIIAYLWVISDDLIKQELKQKIIDNLNKKFDNDLYTISSLKKIIDFNKYFEQYIAEINISKGNGQYVLYSGKPRLDSFVFLNAMIFIYNMKIKSDDKRLKAFTNLSDYMKFFISPEKFDYGKFKLEWLYIAGGREIFYKRFAKITAFKKQFKKALKEGFDNELAELFIKYFLV
jgi:hypothetical protein